MFLLFIVISQASSFRNEIVHVTYINGIVFSGNYMVWLSGSGISAFLGRVWKLPPRRKNMTIFVTRSYRLPLRYIPVFNFIKQLNSLHQYSFQFSFTLNLILWLTLASGNVEYIWIRVDSPSCPFLFLVKGGRKGLCWQIE